MITRVPAACPSITRFWRSFWLLQMLAAFAGLAFAGPGREPHPDFLSAEERAWITAHGDEVRIGPEANYPPFSFVTPNGWQGLSADVMTLIQKRLNVHFQTLAGANLDSLLSAARNGEVDVITSLKSTPERARYLQFTQPYIEVPTAIIVNNRFGGGDWPVNFRKKRIAVGNGYGVHRYLMTHFPDIALVPVPDDLEGLRKLSFGEVDAVIMDVASASFFIARENITNLHIHAAFDYNYELSLGVRSDRPILRDILAKTWMALPEPEREAVRARWINLRPDPIQALSFAFDAWRPWIFSALIALLIIGTSAWRAQRQRRILERRAARYARSLLEASLDPLVTIDALGKITDVNSATERVTGVGRENLIGSDFADYFTDPQQAHNAYRRIFAEGALTDFPLSLRHSDGTITEVLYNGSVYYSDDGAVAGVFATARDITERKRAEGLIQAASVFTHAREGIMITDAVGSILNINEAFTQITGYNRSDAIGQTPRLLRSAHHPELFFSDLWRDLKSTGQWSGEIWNKHKDGRLILCALTITTARGADGTISHYIALFADVTAEREYQQQLEHLAHFDVLTGLPNRLLLSDRLRQNLLQASRNGHTLAVAYLDLDGFKTVNDQHGHDAGDKLLVAIAGHMKESLRDGDTLARMGGDEFVAVLSDLPNVAACAPLLNRLLRAAELPFTTASGITVTVSASIGVTFFPQDQPVDGDQLLRQADQAMYHAKVAGKGRIQTFDAAYANALNPPVPV